MLFSFYYTDRIANLVLEENKLYKEIESKKREYEIKSISAIIEDNYIIPGLNGSAVNVKDSYYNMKAIDVFNSYYLIYSDIYPVVSLNNNVDKIIKKGNSNKNSIALILEYDENIINNLKNYNISVLVNMGTFDSNAKYEQINNEINDFKKLESLLNRYNKNSNVCIINNSNLKLCKENKKFLIKPNKELDNSTYLNIKDSITSGDIILIRSGTKVDYVEIVLRSILYKDYDINFISKHISEERD